jgi:hypothetical protein
MSLNSILDEVATRLKILLDIFPNKHITTNLIEKENSIIKKCISFGSSRSYYEWRILLDTYFTIRDNASVIHGIFRGISLHVRTLKAFRHLFVQIEVN